MRKIKRHFEATSAVCYWPSWGTGIGFFAGGGLAYLLDVKMDAFKFLDSTDDTLQGRLRKHLLVVGALGFIGAFIGNKVQCQGRRSVYDPYFTRALKS